MSKSKPSPKHPLAAKLHTAEGAALLAQRWTEDLLSRPVGELVDAKEAARAIHESLAAVAESESAQKHLLTRVELLAARFEKEKRPLKELVAPAFPAAALRLARRPHQPHRQLVLRMLDREPVRQLIRMLLLEALVDFGRRISAPISSSRVGKGLGALGSLAGAVGAGVLGAVGGELEKQVEKRAAEFADSALSKVLGRMVDLVTDPKHAAEQAELRATIAEGLLEVPAQELVVELRKANPETLLAELRRATREFAEWPQARAELERELSLALAPNDKVKLGALLDELGIRAPIERALNDVLAQRVRAFEWAALFAELEAL
ncbi:MAG: hypothetical protein JST54_15160 [Deltaproteobacteria bacterium]|nr:hypothetical protein [Deltaproteobacteria bacterium]